MPGRPPKKPFQNRTKKPLTGPRRPRFVGTTRPDSVLRRGSEAALPHKPSPSQPRRRPEPPPHADGERLQKVLAAAGLGSRRKCEELITSGRVEVDRQMVTELGTRVDPSRQEIRVDGEPLSAGRRVYYAVNKPRGVVSTNRDPAGRTRVVDLVEPASARLFAIGRLDLSSEGLILVTNDGELANRLTHPRYGVQKTYLAQVVGHPSQEVLDQLRRGIHLAEGVARAEEVTAKSHHKDSTVLEMVLREGRNREIRRVLAKVGHKVVRLTRIAVGPVRLGKLPPGASRRLTHEEVRALHAAAEQTDRRR
jgi:23S rRNA pseudouridine2605 synthase